jgi:TonB family protein
MRVTGKNKKNELSGFLRYSRNKMTDRERNAFERELQKDSFADDAAEGLASIQPEEVEEDLSILRKRLERKTVKKQRFIYYRLAASVAVLMVITTIFILIERNRSSKLMNEISNNRVAIAIPESSPLTKPAGEAGETEKQLTPVQKKEDNSTTVQTFMDAEKVEVQPYKAKSESLTKAENARSLEIKAPERIIVADQLATPAATIVADEAATRNQIRGKVVSSEDNQPIPGAVIIIKGTSIGTITDTGGYFKLTLPDAASHSLVASFIGMESKEFQSRGDSIVKVNLDPSALALNEVVVVGYGTQRKQDITAAGAVSSIDMREKVSGSEYNPPEPVSGRENFDKYIEDNLRRPDIQKKGDRAVVVISFVVQINGSIDSLKIIRSPGQAFSEEAIRLIRQGPGWKPANDKGENIKDEVRIRIVFK